MDSKVYFVTTKNCNISCRHCYVEAGPGQKESTVSSENFEKAVSHLTPKKTMLTLTGGEIFTIRQQLYEYLGIIQLQNAIRVEQAKEPITVELQTNGFWAKNMGTMEKVLDEISSYGVKDIELTSNDLHHRLAGIKREWLIALSDMATGLGMKVKLRGTYDELDQVFPMGRAKGQAYAPRLFQFQTPCYKPFDGPDVSISPDGTVYPCCYQQFPMKGNIFDDSLESIIAAAREDRILTLLNNNGILGAAFAMGHSFDAAYDIKEKYGDCGVCAKLLMPK